MQADPIRDGLPAGVIRESVRQQPRELCVGLDRIDVTAAEGSGLQDIRDRIDAWWPAVESGIEAIVSTASGCGSLTAVSRMSPRSLPSRYSMTR